MKAQKFKGRGAQSKVKNPFLNKEYVQDHWEGIDEELYSSPLTQVYYESPKKVINKVNSPDLALDYSINPYQGCEHGCAYCYARNTHNYWGFDAGLDFESKIIVKREIPILFEKELLHKSWKPDPIMISGNTDCYQPLERKYKLTRQILTIALKYRQPIGIITKNSLIKRDLDVLVQLAKLQLVQVFFSINTLNEHLRNRLEPRTSSIQSKFDTMQLLSKNEIPVGVMVAPIIPGLNHHEIPDILKWASNNGALAAGYTVVRLNGSIGEIFKDWLSKFYPDRMLKVLNQISELHGGQLNDSNWNRRMKGEGPISSVISNLFKVSKEKHFQGKSIPPLNTSLFLKGGNYNLF